jgi:S-adenosylmethionine:tRNA ribosyltransferase-isomerase
MGSVRRDDFDFPLPRELIARHPCEPRDAARLLLIPASGGFVDKRIADLPALLRPGDLLVFNDTKVIPARLVGHRGEAAIEITLYLLEHSPSAASAGRR